MTIRWGIRALAGIASLTLCACDGSGGSRPLAGDGGAASAPSDATTGPGDDAGSTDVAVAPDGPAAGDSGSCSPDPLHTGLTASQTGVSVDAFDCPILKWAARYGELDPMVFKAIIYVESRFDDTAVACPNDPCGVPTGWTAAESGCYGLMQVVPACGGEGDAGLLASGHPNLTADTASGGWAQSIFNPDVNIGIGIGGIAGNRAQVEKSFPGCTVDQYTMMAVGNYNQYGSTKSCTVYNSTYDDAVIAAYTQYAQAAGYSANKY